MASAGTIKVLVVHDDPLMRAGLVAALAAYTDIGVVASDGQCAAERFAPAGVVPLFTDVLVADHSNGIDIAERFARQCTPRALPKIMIVAAHDSEWEIRSALEHGIAGYLLAGCALDDLAIGIRTLHRGARYFSPGVTERLAESLSAEPLTGREEAVLQLVVDGLCNKAIAARLGVALGTVKTHLKAIFDKLGVKTRTQAVIAVSRRGLLGRRMRASDGADTTASGRGKVSGCVTVLNPMRAWPQRVPYVRGEITDH
ncbi:response regulator transcription factor [Dokdonella sp.]|uniref:response regulator transcription factor n=1 Tax=Dokdonella sp. TaxID=2291710 RepID=UPI002F417A7D